MPHTRVNTHELRRIALTALLLAALAAPAAHAQSGGVPNAPWPQLLPPGDAPATVQPEPTKNCRVASVKRCIDLTIRRLTLVRDRFGCDHRAVFADTYLLLTKEIRKTLRQEPHFFDDNNFLIHEDSVFSDFYYRMLREDRLGQPVPGAWRVALDAAKSGDANAAQDMLLGINAHVQRDMPYVVAAVGTQYPDGRTRKHDHDVVNEVLNRAYEAIVADVARRYDPIVATTNSNQTPADNLGGLELVKVWRENVWRNAEALLNSKTPDERAQVEQRIEANAEGTARSIVAVTQPGYRAVRDAYCAGHSAGR